MKKNSYTKIAFLAMSLALIMGMLFAFSISADTSPEIISQNVAYEGDFALMYAVKADTATAPVSLYLYYEEPTATSVAAKKYVSNAPEDIKISGVTVSSYVFKTEGVSAKDMADVFYVQAIDADGDKSDVMRYSVGEYLYERLATEGITEVQEAFYHQTLSFGAAAQALLTPTQTPITEYRFVKVIDGVLADGYSTGIYPIGTKLTPSANGVKAWSVTSYADDKTASQSTIAAGASFDLAGITIVTPSDAEIIPNGTLTFEGSTDLPAEIGKALNSSGSSVSVVSTERDGAATNALKFSTKSGGQDTITLKPTVTEENYDTVAFEFDVNLGTSGGYEMFIRDTKGTQIFKFGVEYGSKWQIKDLSNTSAGYNFWSVNAADANTWVHIRIEITPDPITKMDKLSITYNDTSVNMAVSDKRYHTVGEIFYTADQIAQLDLRSWSSTANDIYFDNVLVEKIATNARPVGTNDIESGSHPSNMSQGKSELITDTVYGESSKVLHLKPDSDGTAEVYNVYANNAIVDAANAQGLGFAADLKFVKNPSGDNAAYDFMLDGYLDGATSTSAVYWLRFISSDGKVYIQNQKKTSEKFEIGVLGEYFYFQAAYVVENGVSMVHIMSNGNYVGTFVTQQNAGSAPIDKINNLRIRTMSNYTSDMYLDNIFVGYCYLPDIQ